VLDQLVFADNARHGRSRSPHPRTEALRRLSMAHRTQRSRRKCRVPPEAAHPPNETGSIPDRSSPPRLKYPGSADSRLGFGTSLAPRNLPRSCTTTLDDAHQLARRNHPEPRSVLEPPARVMLSNQTCAACLIPGLGVLGRPGSSSGAVASRESALWTVVDLVLVVGTVGERTDRAAHGGSASRPRRARVGGATGGAR
jgi:hypothetical protein